MSVTYPVEKIIDEEGNVLALVDVSARALLGDDELQTNAKTCTGGINELKQSLDLLSKWENVFFQTYKNQTTFEIPISAQAGASHFGTYALFNGNCDVMLVIEVGSSSHIKVISASNRTFTLNVTDSKATITASAGLWGMTFIIGYFE